MKSTASSSRRSQYKAISVWRLITHDAYPSGEASSILGSHGLGAIDMWSGLSRLTP